MLVRVSCCPLPGTRRLKPDWLTGVWPPAPGMGEGGVIWDTKLRRLAASAGRGSAGRTGGCCPPGAAGSWGTAGGLSWNALGPPAAKRAQGFCAVKTEQGSVNVESVAAVCLSVAFKLLLCCLGPRSTSEYDVLCRQDSYPVAHGRHQQTSCTQSSPVTLCHCRLQQQPQRQLPPGLGSPSEKEQQPEIFPAWPSGGCWGQSA